MTVRQKLVSNMEINGKELCIGCMKPLDENGNCSHCGFGQKEYKPIPRCLKPGTRLAGRYVLGRVLGEGSFGISYIAWDTLLEVAVAIKEYFPANQVTRHVGDKEDTNVYVYEKGENDRYQENLKKYWNEAKNLSAFSDLDGIVSVKDFFYENQTAYIVMAYVNGISVKEYVEQNGRIPGSQLMEMVKPVLAALGKVHETGMLHRDISPDNMLITKEHKLVLIDFGAARRENISKTRSMTVVFKRGYSPEEQYRTRGKQGAWSDIYALCATIYYALVGEAPDEAIDRLLEDEMVSLTDMKDIDLTEGQKRTIMKGIAVKPQERYQSIEMLYQALYEEEKPEVISVFRLKIIAGMAITVFLAAIIGIGIWKMGNKELQNISVSNPVSAEGDVISESDSSVPEEMPEEWVMDAFEKLTQKEAEKLVQKKAEELPMVQWNKAYSDTIKKGRIISQSIPVGTKYIKGEYEELLLVVSKGKEKVAVPMLTGMTKAEAVKKLRKLGLKWKIQTREDASAKGTVLSQSVKKGKKVIKGKSVTLTISSGVVQTVPAATQTPSRSSQSQPKQNQNGNDVDFEGIIP